MRACSTSMHWYTPAPAQPLDVVTRVKAARLLRAYLAGAIDNDTLHDDWPYGGSPDPSLDALFCFLWGFYDDLSTHRFDGHPEARRVLEHCATFLESDVPYAWRPPAWPVRVLATVAGIVTLGIASRAWSTPKEWPFPPQR